MLRLGLVAIMGGVAGVLAFHIPGLEVELLGEPSRGLFMFYSAALPVMLLFLCSWLEEGSVVSQLLANGAAIGAGAALAVRLAIELVSAAPVITFPFFGTLFEDTLVDERGWLAANAIVSALAAFTAFTSAGDDSGVDSE